MTVELAWHIVVALWIALATVILLEILRRVK